jgi:hypothetical protein
LYYSSPYAFRNFSRRQQEKILAGFIAGIMTMNKDLFPYWAGPPLKGDGTQRRDWVPEGIEDMLEANGFHTERIPVSVVHEVGVSGIGEHGSLELEERPFADPDLHLDEQGKVFLQKPVAISSVTILEGFSLRPPLERLQKDIQEVYGITLAFPAFPSEDEPDIASVDPLPEQLYDSARRTIAEAFEKYPPDYIRNLHLNNIKTVDRLFVRSDEDPTEVAEYGGITRYKTNSFYYVYRANSHSTIHHEIRHFADGYLGKVNDEAWMALNPRGSDAYIPFDYETYLNERKNSQLGPVPKGFVSHYAAQNSREDRAVIAEMLFSEPSTLARLMRSDEILQTKVAYLMQILEDESDGHLTEGWLRQMIENEHPFTDPPIFGQLVSYGYLTHQSDYLNALERKARKLGPRTTYSRD